MSYTTLARVQAELKGSNTNLTPGVEQLLMQYIRTVTNRIRAFKYEFEPLYATKRYTPNGMSVNSRRATFQLDDYLLEPDSVSIGGVSLTYGTNVVGDPNDGQSPLKMLRIVDPWSAPAQSWYPCCVQTFIDSIEITGFWGMREYYQSMGFFDSGQDVPVGDLSASAVTMVITDVDGLDPYNRTPLFSAGNLCRIDDELIEIVKTDTVTNTLTMIRGARGTTAAAHTAGTAIQIWETEEDVTNMATRQVGLLYARRGAYQQVTSYPDGVNVTYPSDLLAEIRATVQRFNYV